MNAKIKMLYDEKPSYKLVADKLGLNWKTVKAHVTANVNAEKEKELEKTEKEVMAAPFESKEQDSQAASVALSPESITMTTMSNSPQAESVPRPLLQRKEKNNEKSPFARALRLFEKGRTPVQAAIELDITFEDVKQYYAQYGRLQGLLTFFKICQGEPATLTSILKLHDKMLKAEMNPTQIVRQLDYVGPIERTAETYQRLKESSQKLEAEVQEKGKKNADLDADAGQLKVRFDSFQNKITVSRGQQNTLDQQCRQKQAAIDQIRATQLKSNAQVKSARATFDELTAEQDGPIQIKIKEVMAKEADEVLNNNKWVFDTSVAAGISIMMQNPVWFSNFRGLYPILPREGLAAYRQRCITFVRAKFLPVFDQVRAQFVRELSSTVLSNDTISRS